jgi:hypothetical protein
MTPWMYFSLGCVTAGILIFGGALVLAMLLPHRKFDERERNFNRDLES